MNEFQPPSILVVCTANVCRSPVAERLLDRHLRAVGVEATVSSAGTHGGHNVVHPDTIAAAARLDVDLTDHDSRRVTHRLLRTEGADLVVTMTREHVYQVVALDESAWPRTFTLRELERRAAVVDAGSGRLSPDEWVRAIGAGRQSSELLPGRRSDDVDDPYGRAARHHRKMIDQVDRLCASIARHAARVIAPTGE